MSFLLIYLSISVVAGAVLIYFIAKSPEGWEDSEGFHYAKLQPQITSVKKLKFTKPVLENNSDNKILGKPRIHSI